MTIEDDIKKAELLRIESETRKNNAELKIYSRKKWVQPLLNILAVFVTTIIFLTSFTGFTVDLYQVALVELPSLKKQLSKIAKENEFLKKKNEVLQNCANLLRDTRTELDTALAALVKKEQINIQLRHILSQTDSNYNNIIDQFENRINQEKLNINELDNMIFILSWGSSLADILIFRFVRMHDEYFGVGFYLADNTKTSQIPSEWWALLSNQGCELKLSQTYPPSRINKQETKIIINLCQDYPNGGWAATRWIEGSEQKGKAELIVLKD